MTVIKLTHGLDRAHPIHISMEYMADRLAEKSDQTMRIAINPSGSSGVNKSAWNGSKMAFTSSLDTASV